MLLLKEVGTPPKVTVPPCTPRTQFKQRDLRDLVWVLGQVHSIEAVAGSDTDFVLEHQQGQPGGTKRTRYYMLRAASTELRGCEPRPA